MQKLLGLILFVALTGFAGYMLYEILTDFGYKEPSGEEQTADYGKAVSLCKSKGYDTAIWTIGSTTDCGYIYK